MNKNLTILVNTSDGFEDCWIPFFTLFKKYWPQCDAKILLNTELKDFSFPGLDIQTTRVNDNISKKLTWSECLIKALNMVDTPFVLYLQEDYFIERAVNNKTINEFVDLMFHQKEIKYIGLTNNGNCPPFLNFEQDPRLKIVSRNSKYRISTQAALWDKETLLSYLIPDENGWMFEIFATKRAKKRDDLFLTINRDLFKDDCNSIIFYQLTGIVKGKWIKTMPKLFKKEGIDIDFTIRGFYKELNWLNRKLETIRMLTRKPMVFLRKYIGN
jgi:hypothetical protein